MQETVQQFAEVAECFFSFLDASKERLWASDFLRHHFIGIAQLQLQQPGRMKLFHPLEQDQQMLRKRSCTAFASKKNQDR